MKKASQVLRKTERLVQIDLEGRTLEPSIEASQCLTLDNWQELSKATPKK
ncbi:MAG: hypothetical protein ACYCQJ_05360 [Nitrososphaerales archaeon]